MKTIKIFGLGSHQTKERTAGVDFARVIQPIKHLDGYSNGKYKFKTDIYDIFKQKEFNWKNVSRKYDLVFLNYTALDWAYAAMGMFVHGAGKKIIMDVDDAIWHINRDNIAHDAFKKIGAGKIISCILKDVDGVTTTNSYLKNMIMHEADVSYDKVMVFPNSVDLKYYNHKSSAKEDQTITLLHYGSTTHFEDLSENGFVEGVNKIFKEYPNVVLKAIGANLPKLKLRWGERYSYDWGHSDIYHWINDKFPIFMDEADVIVVPLQDNTYNRCKSDIKFIETATATKPGVFSDIRPYHETVKHGITGFLANNSEQWYESLKTLVDSKEKRQEIGDNAYKYVVKERQIEKLVPAYANFIIDILNK